MLVGRQFGCGGVRSIVRKISSRCCAISRSEGSRRFGGFSFVDTWQPRINPAFHRHPQEAAIIGRLCVAFGELEYIMCATAGRAAGALHPVLKALYRMRAISARINAADALMRPAFQQIQKEGEYGVMLGAIRYCLRIRNQYGHCNWGDDKGYPGLFFTNLEETAAAADGFELRWHQ
jgi:hypothetical protein